MAFKLFNFQVRFVAVRGLSRKNYKTEVPAVDSKSAVILAAHKMRIDRSKYSISTLIMDK